MTQPNLAKIASSAAAEGDAALLARTLEAAAERGVDVSEPPAPKTATLAMQFSRNLRPRRGASARENRLVARCSPLMAAAAAGHLECVHMILEKKAFAGASGLGDALCHAAACGQTECMRAILDAGGRLVADWESEEGRTPLIVAAEGGHLDCVTELLPFADPRARTMEGRDALMHAAAGGWLDCMQALAPFSDTLALDARGFSLAMVAATRDSPDALAFALALPGGHRLSSTPAGATALMLAAAADSLACVEMLLPRSDVRAEDKNLRTALWNASRDGPSCVEALIPGSNIEANDDDMWDTPLLAAIRAGHAGAAKSLLAAGADPSATDAAQCGALHLASRSCVELMEALVRLCDPNARDAGGQTPLMRAVDHRDPSAELSRTLAVLLPETDLSLVDSKGFRADQLAERCGNVEGAALIRGYAQAMADFADLSSVPSNDLAPARKPISL